MLPAEFEAGELSVAQTFPKSFFSLGLVLPKITGLSQKRRGMGRFPAVFTHKQFFYPLSLRERGQGVRVPCESILPL